MVSGSHWEAACFGSFSAATTVPQGRAGGKFPSSRERWMEAADAGRGGAPGTQPELLLEPQLHHRGGTQLSSFRRMKLVYFGFRIMLYLWTSLRSYRDWVLSNELRVGCWMLLTFKQNQRKVCMWIEFMDLNISIFLPTNSVWKGQENSGNSILEIVACLRSDNRGKKCLVFQSISEDRKVEV